MTELLLMVLAIIGAAAWEELREWMPRIAEKIVLGAARNGALEDRERMAEEWVAEYRAMPGKIIPLLSACNLWWGVSKSNVLRAIQSSTIFNKSLALILLTFLSPLLVTIVIALKVQNRGPTLFAHYRVGRDGRLFRLLHFRICSLQQSDQQKITSFGGFLKRTGMNELPALLNVLRGELDFVGPHPVTLHDLQKIDDLSFLAHNPGLMVSWRSCFEETKSILQLWRK